MPRSRSHPFDRRAATVVANVSIMPFTAAEMAAVAVAIFAIAIAALVWFGT
jgi:hypothetical protein